MAVISGGKVIEGSVGTILNAGAPSAGTNDVQTLTFSGSPTDGSVKLAVDGIYTAAINHDDTAAAVQATLEAVGSVGAGNVQVTGSDGGPYTVTASGERAHRALSIMTLVKNDLVGGSSPTLGIVHTTPGVPASGLGAAKGTILVDTVNGKAYINTGDGNSPTWTVVGTQS